MSSEEKKRQRCVGFSGEEKLLIANVCAKYKHILENKKTDATSNDVKNRTWERIACEVNSAAINTSFRSSDVLKRFYENRKREVRKIAAEEKKEIYGTGGGPPTKFKKEACHDILSAMNSKTVYGLNNDFDGDAEPISSLIDSDITQVASSEENYQPCNTNDVEIIYESNENEQGITTWKKYTPADLKQPITTNLINNIEDKKPGPSSSKRKNTEDTLETPKKQIKLPSSRRRPAIEVKALTRSELAEKYDQLLDRRLETTEAQKRKIEEEIVTIQDERKLRCQLLTLEIEVAKEKLRQLKN